MWSGWGAAQATASGTASVNTCDPSCAEGTRENYPVVLTASELRDRDFGRMQYTRVSYSFPAASPSGLSPEQMLAHVMRYWEAVNHGWWPSVAREQWVGPHHPFSSQDEAPAR